jgi:hypothetical protein
MSGSELAPAERLREAREDAAWWQRECDRAYAASELRRSEASKLPWYRPLLRRSLLLRASWFLREAEYAQRRAEGAYAQLNVAAGDVARERATQHQRPLPPR